MKIKELSQIVVRTAYLTDAARIACLFAELGYPDAACGLEARLQQQIGDANTNVFVAHEGDETVGVLVMHVFAPLHVARPWAVVSALVVDQRCRSHGAGAILIAHAQQAAAARHCAHLELSCSERRTRAHAFYEGQGFVEVRKRFTKKLPG